MTCLPSRIALLLGLAVLLTTTQTELPAADPAKTISITGLVYNDTGKAIPGVQVSVWVVGKTDSVASTRTRADGRYNLDGLQLSGSFDVSYTHSRFMVAVVSRLAETQSQSISKVLYAKGSRVPASVAGRCSPPPAPASSGAADRRRRGW